MPDRHFYLLSHYISYGLFIFCVLAPRGMNAIVLGDEGRSQKATATQKVCLSGIFTCSHITFPMVYSFYFLCFGSRRNEYNSFWEREGGEVRSLLLVRKTSLSWNFIYLFSHYICNGLFFLFSVFWLQKE